MRIGFYTSTFNDRPVDEVLDFARDAGFDAVELDVAGHIESPDNVGAVVAKARERGLFVSSITLVGNQLDPIVEKRNELRARTYDFAIATNEARVPILVIFPGRDNTASEDKNYKSFAEHANDLLALTAAREIYLAIENWPGPKNDFIATTPGGWQKLFTIVPDKRFGLEFDPSHPNPTQASTHSQHSNRFRTASENSSMPRTVRSMPKHLQAVGYHGRWVVAILPAGKRHARLVEILCGWRKISGLMRRSQ